MFEDGSEKIEGLCVRERVPGGLVCSHRYVGSVTQTRGGLQLLTPAPGRNAGAGLQSLVGVALASECREEWVVKNGGQNQ